MSWKVYNIHTGKIVKAGFEEEDAAKDWLELRRDLPTEDYLVEELDEEEEDALEDEDDDSPFVPDDVVDEDVEDISKHGIAFVDDEDEDVDEDLDDDEDEEDEEDEDEDDDY